MPLDSDVATKAAEEKTSPSHPFPVADLEHPWLGLESFREETRAYFFGRDAEIAELHLRVRSHPLLVLYGRSGLGKTSILSAGLIPQLRDEKQRPLLLRLRYLDDYPSPLEQIAIALFSSEKDTEDWRAGNVLARLRQQTLAFNLPNDHPSRLWLHLHRRKQSPSITHLILDQFEEVFTLGVRWPDGEHEVRDALAILLQGAIPEPISRLIAEEDSFLDHFDPDSTPVRVILALRDDYVYALNRWRRYLPALGQNNFELQALRGPAAFDAVFKPGELRCRYRGEVSEKNEVETGLPPIVDEETAQRIVRFVAEKGEQVPIEEIEAVPPILSLLCRELNERRFTEPAGSPENPTAQIIFREGETDIEAIITAFYERCLAGRPEAVRIFIEEEFVSPYSGARLPQDEHSILKVFADGCEIPGAADGRLAAGYGDSVKARACLEDLVNRRLLSSLGGGENPSYELIHDLLAAVAERSRTAREQRFEKEQANRRAAAARKAKQDAEELARLTRSRARWIVIAVSVALIAAVLAATYSFVQYGNAKAAEQRAIDEKQQAEKARADAEAATTRAEMGERAAKEAKDKAVAAKRDADGLIRFMQYDLSERLDKVGRLDMMASINAWIRKYHEDHPPEASDLGALREESVSLSQQGDLLRAQGDLAGALKSYRDSLAIREKLSKQDPGNAGWQRDLSSSYEKVGNVQRDQGDLAGALKSYRDSLAIFEKLAKQDPGNAGGQFALAGIHCFIGIALKEQGKVSEALGEYQAYRDLMEQLSKQDPGNAGWQRDLSVSYNKVGDVQSAQGDLAGALKSYREGLAIAEKLTKQDPGNAQWQYDLGISHERLGNVFEAQGKQDEALKEYRAKQALIDKLAKQDPGNAGWQRDLSISYQKIGYAQEHQEDFAAAAETYRKSLSIFEKLAKQDPGNAQWQGDLAWNCWAIGRTSIKADPKSKADAQAMVKKGHDILRQLKERTGLPPEQQRWLDAIEADLRKWKDRK